MTIYAVSNQEMAEEMGNQSQKYIGEFDFLSSILFKNIIEERIIIQTSIAIL